MLGWVIVIGILPYLVAVLMPGWRALALCVVLIGSGLTALWTQHFIAVQSPDYNEGPLPLGLAFGIIATVAFVIGAAVRALSLALVATGWSFGRVFAINTLGFALVIAVFVVMWGA